VKEEAMFRVTLLVGVLDGTAERSADGRRIELRGLPIEAVVREIATRAVL
jgi:hypothetical protein